MQRLAPEAEVFEVSALKGDGLDALAEWLVRKRNALLGPKRGQDSFSVRDGKES